ncbi:hypothetical protein H0H28_05275 [Corynebacterium sanguinis]|uniref:Uncharacterized protein n=2 Tax=Corynebacteriaceae TaxID=1653 RepID=A0A6C1TU94_9CORY|nr:hypothetical protein [Corynebacterium sanguinis]TVS25765.1 hypothetical protein EKI59_11375 [Corynebacterium sanguinis]TVS26137.1 hypothetical protein EKI56_07485 [Corynebacterium sanguinis]
MVSKNTSEEKSGELSSRGALFLFIGSLVLLFGLELYGVYLLILAFVVTFGSLITGIFLILRSYSSGDQETQAVTMEIEAMANDASFDISEQIIFWDKIKYTKGVGTQLEGRDEEISDIHRRLVNVREEIAAAETPQHRLEAVLTADSVLATARLLH